MEKIIILFNLCLPNDGAIECIFIEEEIKNQQMCEQKVEQLEHEFSDLLEVHHFSVKCEKVEA
jgi:hypothetical protein|tara:strand:- start:887 stop:1075 length:189 start_codon:yes stop_codon:yes gene_type:complete